MSENQEQVKKEQKSQSFWSRLFGREEEKETHVISKPLSGDASIYQGQLQALSAQAVKLNTLSYQTAGQAIELTQTKKHGTRWQSDKNAERSKSERNAAAKTQQEEDKARLDELLLLGKVRSDDTAEQRVHRSLITSEYDYVTKIIPKRFDITGHDRRSHMMKQKKTINHANVQEDALHLIDNFRLDLILDGETPFDKDMEPVLDVFCANYYIANRAQYHLTDRITELGTDPGKMQEIIDELEGRDKKDLTGIIAKAKEPKEALTQEIRSRKKNIEDFSYPLMSLGSQAFVYYEMRRRDLNACKLAMAQIRKEMQEIDPCPYGQELLRVIAAREADAQQKLNESKRMILEYINNPDRHQYYDEMGQLGVRIRNTPNDPQDATRKQLLDEGVQWYASLPIMKLRNLDDKVLVKPMDEELQKRQNGTAV